MGEEVEDDESGRENAVVVLGGTVPASGGSERMTMLLKAGTFPRGSAESFPRNKKHDAVLCCIWIMRSITVVNEVDEDCGWEKRR